MRVFYIFFVLSLLSGCINSEDEDSQSLEGDGYGFMKSKDLIVFDLDKQINGAEFTFKGEKQEVILTSKIGGDGHENDVNWYITFRTNSSFQNDWNGKLFKNYQKNPDLGSYYEEFYVSDMAEESYVIMSGSLNVDASLNVGDFDVVVEREMEIGSGVTDGVKIQIYGSWNFEY
jgi:hypothetical protein